MSWIQLIDTNEADSLRLMRITFPKKELLCSNELERERGIAIADMIMKTKE